MNKTILIVEDDLLIARAYKTGLEKKGYAVTMVHNGSEAIEQMHNGNYDLILLDIMLPGQNGFEILKERNEQLLAQNAKIIVLSNLGQPEDMEQATALGADGYLIKAHQSMGEVMTKVEEILAI